jgi:outer membrane protein
MFTNTKYQYLFALTIGLFKMLVVHAQTLPDTLIQMKGAVQMAEQRYHLLKSNQYESDAAAKYIAVVKYSKLPSVDASYQAGAGTANNLTGIFYPYGILPVTGPPSTDNNYDPVTGSAASVLLNWQAVTFGQRDAQINVAIAEAKTKKSVFKQAAFQHTINVISAYLDLLLTYDVVHIQRENIERNQANLKQSRVLVNSGIKPGVDTALFLSELSKAKIDLLNSQKQLRVYQLQLAQLIVTDALPVPQDSSFLQRLPVPITSVDSSFANTPIIQSGQSQLELSHSKEMLLRKSYMPKLNVWGTGFARGSGFQANGSEKTWNGLTLNRFNYGAGVQLVFPVMKYGEVKKQLLQQNLLSKAAMENIAESNAILTTQKRIADVTFDNSIAVANETIQQLKSGQYAFNAMQIRYNTGLVNFSDLIQSQYNLLKAELDSKKSYWDAWRALLMQAAVSGDENIFLNAIQ